VGQNPSPSRSGVPEPMSQAAGGRRVLVRVLEANLKPGRCLSLPHVQFVLLAAGDDKLSRVRHH